MTLAQILHWEINLELLISDWEYYEKTFFLSNYKIK